MSITFVQVPLRQFSWTTRVSAGRCWPAQHRKDSIRLPYSEINNFWNLHKPQNCLSLKQTCKCLCVCQRPHNLNWLFSVAFCPVLKGSQVKNLEKEKNNDYLSIPRLEGFAIHYTHLPCFAEQPVSFVSRACIRTDPMVDSARHIVRLSISSAFDVQIHQGERRGGGIHFRRCKSICLQLLGHVLYVFNSICWL